MPRDFFLIGLLICAGCAHSPDLGKRTVPTPSGDAAPPSSAKVDQAEPAVRMVGYEVEPDEAATADETSGKEVARAPLSFIETEPSPPPVVTADPQLAEPPLEPPPSVPVPPTVRQANAVPMTILDEGSADLTAGFHPPAGAEVLDLNLPTAMSMIGGAHPAVGFAQWRVQEAYADLAQAEVLWLPSLQAGFSFHRHDGNYQASDGTIVDVNRNSLQYGLGTGATGAGTTPRPGVIAQFHVADAIFQPQIAEKRAWAQGHAANAVINEQLLRVALRYFDLLAAYQDARIVEETRDRTVELSRLTRDFAETGQGLQADADRLATEAILVRSRQVATQERIQVAAAQLAQALSIDAGHPIAPLDPTVLPIELVSLQADKPALIRSGLANRPELKESQALVVAACEAYRRERYAPFVPSVLLGFSTGGFGGGLGNDVDNVDNRYDFDALMSWEVRNLGFGERAARRQASARVQQARFEKVRVMDQVAREVAEAYSQVQYRGEQVAITQQAIELAENSYQRNLARIRDGQGLPIEVLQSIRALEEARRAYLDAVIDFNQAQFQLQYALGWPVTAPATN